MAGAGFSNIPGKYENVLLSTILETGTNVFKSNYQIIKARIFRRKPIPPYIFREPLPLIPKIFEINLYSYIL